MYCNNCNKRTGESLYRDSTIEKVIVSEEDMYGDVEEVEELKGHRLDFYYCRYCNKMYEYYYSTPTVTEECTCEYRNEVSIYETLKDCVNKIYVQNNKKTRIKTNLKLLKEIMKINNITFTRLFLDIAREKEL